MRINLITIGTRMPAWVTSAYQDYVKRLPQHCKLHLIELPLEKRHSEGEIPRLIEREGEKLLANTKTGNQLIALDVKGKLWSTEDLAKQLQAWMQQGGDIDLLVGGPDGLSNACLTQAQTHWSLSPLTLPHPLVRIVIAEQIYRAWSLLNNHPYHRA